MIWRDLLIKYKVSGVKAHDAKLAASALAHEIDRILTFNTRDFRRYAEVEAVGPDEVGRAAN